MNLYDIQVYDGDNQLQSLSQYKNQVLLIVNTATECEFTEQYDELEDLYEKYHEQGLTILDFPCNQFGEQAPGTMEEIMSFCADTYGVSFPQFAKIEVNGPNESPVYTYLKRYQDQSLSARIEWNFTKFLIDRNGQVVKRFEPLVRPYEIEIYIENCLKRKSY
ncbi:glutathione peroxidase [Candidatus Stoquefichus massiliensis]|uniref:glutathione peroxidase n=1 Tax=Candidatus Stoquefichus massiliensis TaxID=1470350 RepID=UPI000482C571|nr:glutathione peroxidase [Candidatus Stoquefichus massiliensis]